MGETFTAIHTAVLNTAAAHDCDAVADPGDQVTTMIANESVRGSRTSSACVNDCANPETTEITQPIS
jgi:hypothetical protein